MGDNMLTMMGVWTAVNGVRDGSASPSGLTGNKAEVRHFARWLDLYVQVVLSPIPHPRASKREALVGLSLRRGTRDWSLPSMFLLFSFVTLI